MEISERDWNLFKEKIPTWQENYIMKLNKTYRDILQSDSNPSEIFWKLEKQINIDKKRTGVIADMRRSMLVANILSLLADGAIDFADLSEFSDELKERLRIFLKL